MPLPSTDLIALSRLLDEALDLEPAQVEAWLAGLPKEHSHLRSPLSEMLARTLHGDPSFLANGPKLAGRMDETVARAGELVGPYRLIREIGQGGMGAVWLAEKADGSLKRKVALKLPRLAWGAGLAERMARERDIGALLEHPNIARLYDAGVDQHGRPYLALEYIDGQPLDAWCEARSLSVREKLKLFVQVARAVAYAHGRLVVHRDIKPSNVLVTTDGQVHLLDFGIAKLLHEAGADDQLTLEQGGVLTPRYASPEQIRNETITVASDVYSLGVLLYELLTGRSPYELDRRSLAAIEEAILRDEAAPASSRAHDKAAAKALRGEIDAILAKALKREPDQRYATADAFAEDVERYLNGDTVLARPDSLGYRLRKAVRRHWVGVTALAAVLFAVLAGSAVAVVQSQRAARSAERERIVKEFVGDVFRVNSRVDPQNAAIRPPSTQALLEGGARLIQQRFSGQPDLQAELYGVVGGVFSDMGAYKLAADYSTKRIEALALLQPEPAEQAKALMALGEALLDDRRYADAEPRLRRAVELSSGSFPLHVDALVLLALVQRRLGQEDAHHATRRVAEALLASKSSAPSAAAAWLLYFRAVDEKSLEAALPLVQQAIDMAMASEGPLSKTAIKMRLRLLQGLANSQQVDETKRQLDTTVQAMKQLGGAYEVRAAFESAVIAATRYTRAGQITAVEAMDTILSNRAQLAASNLPMPEWFVPFLDFWLGLVKVNYGDVGEGLQLIEASAPVLRRASDLPEDQWLVSRGLAEALMESGRHDLANAGFLEMLAFRKVMDGGLHPFGVPDYLFIAENLLMQGKLQAAETALDQAPNYEALPKSADAEVVRMRRISNLRLVHMRAAVHLAAGNVPSALALLEESRPTEGANLLWATEYDPTLGEALCAAGRYRDGYQVVSIPVAEYERGVSPETGASPSSPRLARLRAVAGLCAIGMGDRATARDLATKARAAFEAQPGVSPYFKAPLFKLERALGVRAPRGQ